MYDETHIELCFLRGAAGGRAVRVKVCWDL